MEQTPSSPPEDTEQQQLPNLYLIRSVRYALASLYSLTSTHDNHQPHHQQEANAYLIRFQSRNERRRNESKRRSLADRRKSGKVESDMVDDEDDDEDSAEEDYSKSRMRMGSTFLTCVDLLSSHFGNDPTLQSREEERVFAAQTILSRMHNMSSSDAVDFEFEPTFGGCEQLAQDSGNSSNIAGSVVRWYEQFHPLLGQLARRWYDSNFGRIDQVNEERIKSELAVLTSAALSYLTAIAAAGLVPPTRENSALGGGPVLSYLGSMGALAALRYRAFDYHNSLLSASTLNGPGIVEIVSKAILTVSKMVEEFQGGNDNGNADGSWNGQILSISTRVSCSMLGCIPEAILSESAEGGGRSKSRRPSIDPQSLFSAKNELHHLDSGIGSFERFLLYEHGILPVLKEAQAFGGNHGDACDDANKPMIYAHVLNAFEKWADYVPVPAGTVELLAKISGWYLMQYAHIRRQKQHRILQHQHEQQQESIGGCEIAQKASFSFLTALFESSATALSSNNPNPDQPTPGTKKQKKRNKNSKVSRTQSPPSSDARHQAYPYSCAFGDVACLAATFAWDGIEQAVSVDTEEVVQGHLTPSPSPSVLCLTTCAAGCLPHLIERHRIRQQQQRDGQEDEQTQTDIMLMTSLGKVLKSVAGSNHRNTRALTYEPLDKIHLALVNVIRDSTLDISNALFDLAFDCVYQSVMNLASACAYPSDYFHNLTVDNDEDLENERNDIRDVMRSVSGSDDAAEGGGMKAMPSVASIKILARIVQACADAVANCSTSSPNGLPPEAAVHALSALAKPLNRLVIGVMAQSRGASTSRSVLNGDIHSVWHLIEIALRTLGDVSLRLVDAFAEPSKFAIGELFPVSRLACMGTASYSPLFSCLASVDFEVDENGPLGIVLLSFKRTLNMTVKAIATSIVHIPELFGESSLGRTVYDIRGAFRGPGGEDHVGCIALMRLSSETDNLTRAILNSCSSESDGDSAGCSVVLSLCDVHDKLKVSELGRSAGVHHGVGVVPKSRRVLLRTISCLGLFEIETLSRNVNHSQNGVGTRSSSSADAITSRLQELFHGPLLILKQLSTADDNSISQAEKLFRICEAVFDLASFPSAMTSTLFRPENNTSEQPVLEAIRFVIEACTSGYKMVLSERSGVPDIVCLQWGRLRGAIVSMFRSSANPGLPTQIAAEALVALIRAECEAVTIQCHSGPDSSSSIFHDAVVGEDLLPSGAFVMVIGEILKGIRSMSKDKNTVTHGELIQYCQQCVLVLQECVEPVLNVLATSTPEAIAHVDPRPTIAEAWYLSMNSLLSIFCSVQASHSQLLSDPVLRKLISASCFTAIQLFFFRRLAKGHQKEKDHNNGGVRQIGLSLDGPQSLAMIDFLEISLSLSPEILVLIANEFQTKLRLDMSSMSLRSVSDDMTQNTALVGGVITGAAFFRASSGGLPPWAVEGMPKLYGALFVACGNDPDNFIHVLGCASSARLLDTASNEAVAFGGVRPGEKLAGRFFETLTETSVDIFLSKARSICTKNDKNSWRCFKVLVKQLCGGKKKGSGFNLKPAVTSWDCDRV